MSVDLLFLILVPLFITSIIDVFVGGIGQQYRLLVAGVCAFCVCTMLLILGFVFAVACRTEYDTSVVSTETYNLGEFTGHDETYYLIQSDDEISYVMLLNDERGLWVKTTGSDDITIDLDYTDDVATVEIETAIMRSQSRWLFLYSKGEETTQYEYHFRIPEGSVLHVG